MQPHVTLAAFPRARQRLWPENRAVSPVRMDTPAAARYSRARRSRSQRAGLKLRTLDYALKVDLTFRAGRSISERRLKTIGCLRSGRQYGYPVIRDRRTAAWEFAAAYSRRRPATRPVAKNRAGQRRLR